MNDLLGAVRPKDAEGISGQNPAYASPGTDVEMGEVGLGAPMVCAYNALEFASKCLPRTTKLRHP